jgi:SlyX protein
MMNEDRLIEIEIKIARQEDLVETLNQVVCQQQKKIAELEALGFALARRLRELSGSGMASAETDERPPHY